MFKKFWLLITIFWCALIYLFTATPSFTAKNTGSVVQDTVQASYHAIDKDANKKVKDLTVGHLNMVMRKSAHVVLFGMLACLTYKAIRLKRNSYIVSWIFVTVYAASDEWHQSFVPGRGASVRDVVLDSAAAFMCLAIIFLGQSKRMKKTRSIAA